MSDPRFRPAGAVPRAAACLLLVGLSLAGDPAMAQRHAVERYTTADGLPSARVTTLAQDAAGYLWFGTAGGLARYDGGALETLVGAASGVGIAAILPAPDDGVWVATEAGLLGVWRDEVFTPVFDARGEVSGAAALTIDSTGSMWLAVEDRVVRVDPPGGVTEIPVAAEGCCRTALRDRRGRIWVGTDRGLATLRDGRLAEVDIGLPAGTGVNLLLEDRAGTLWAGTDRGLYRETGAGFRRYGTPLGPEPVILSGVIDARGRIWFGGERGAFRIAGAVDRVLTAANGLPDNRVNAIALDREETIWFATDAGVGKLVASPFATYTAEQGLAGDYVVGVEVDEAGRVWVAGRDGVAVVENDEVRRVPLENLGSATVTALDRTSSGRLLVATSHGLIVREGDRETRAEPGGSLSGARPTAVREHGGQIWLGTDRGLYVLDDGGLREPAGTEAMAGVQVTVLEVDSRGRLWVGTRGRGLFVRTSRGFEAVEAEELAGGRIRDLAAGQQGAMWVAAQGAGVVSVAGAPPFPVESAMGGESGEVLQLLVDRTGDLWVYTSLGLFRWEPRSGPTHFGLQNGLADLSATPRAAAAGPDGRLWFGTPSGLTVYEPESSRAEPVAPTVVIREVRVDQVAATGSTIELDHTHRELTIVYSALTFRREQETRFHYRLIGHSRDWSPLTSQRRVTFGNLPAGSYRFEVEAITASGLWSPEPATLQVLVEPAFWEEPWFLVVGLAIAIGLVLVIFRARLRTVDDERQRLRLMVDRRTRELVEKNSLLERMATTDELTGLPNRRFFLDSMERELRKLSRTPSPQPLSLLVLDIDRFKAINDRHGHAAGDEVLRRLGRRLSQSVRATDLPSRYGGEEFAILLPATDSEGARFLAEKLRGEVEAMDVRYEGRRIPVTISLGIAAVDGTVRYEREVEEDLLRRADEAMYKAKSSGRNRVVVDTDPVEIAEDEPPAS